MTRTPLLQSISCHMWKAVLQLSQNLRMSGGSRSYCRRRESCHSCAPSSVPFIVDCCTISHASVFVAHRNMCVSWKGAPASASSDRFEFRFLTSYLPSLIHAVWSAVMNSFWPLSAATRCTTEYIFYVTISVQRNVMCLISIY